ncbi:MAG: helix-turn-helix transcriptional regulator [Legionella sp.]|nr:helix-turn-helix transcriptional regulator [Legionella sp.]
MISNQMKSFFDQMPGACGCKDLDSVFMHANQDYVNIIGLGHKEDIVGRTDFDMPCDTINAATMFREQDARVMQSLHKMRILDIHPFAGRVWKAYIFTKTPLMNGDECVGTIFHGTDITNAASLEIGSLLARTKIEGIENNLVGQHSYMLSHHFNDIKLTDRQAEVLFYLLRGKTAKQIGQYLNVSSRTIHEHMDQLKFKLNAQNKHELIDMAIAYGFLNIVPDSIFRTQLSIELKDT